MKNIEIKAKCPDPEKLHLELMKLGADYKGMDHQIDTYFNVQNGRLKFREGNIENALISYNRPDQADAKLSDFTLYHSEDTDHLKGILTERLGIKVIVDKKRRIYYIDHVKFHIDEIRGIEPHMEIEVTDMTDIRTIEEMERTCVYYMSQLGISSDDLVSNSYSDLLLA